MLVTLHHKQCVLVNSVIRFRHYTLSGNYHEIVLNKRQLENLNDVIDNLRVLNSLNYYPLGGGIWFVHRGPNIKLIDNHTHTFFRFYQTSWYTYVKTHSRLRRFLRDGKSYHHQSHANHERGLSHRLRSVAHLSSKVHKAVPWTARNASDDHDERSKCANVSRRESSNSRPHSERRGGKHEKRSHHETEESKLNATQSSDEDDYYKYGGECTVKEEDMSTEDCD